MKKKTISAAALILSLGAGLAANALNTPTTSDSLFNITEATSLTTGPSAADDHKCGEGKCGDDHKCGEGKCGDDHKCGEGKCGH